MSDFVLRLPLTPAPPEAAAGPDRLAALVARGWRPLAPVAEGARGALRGEAALARVAAGVMIGVAVLNNRAELQDRLGMTEVAGAQIPDLELLARLWDKEGAAFPDAVSGAFSVVTLAADTGQGCAWRDHFGVLPLRYCVHDGQLTCGSDLRAVLHLSGLPLAPDAARIADFIVGDEVDRTRTAFDGLWRLPAAHALDWASGPPEPRRYWQLTLTDPMPAEAAVEGFGERLRLATEACVARPEGVGAMLSGGLDSSVLAGLAARALAAREAPPLPTLSFTYEGKPYDESAYIAAANGAFRTTPHLIPISEAPRLTAMPEIVDEQMDLFLAYGLPKSRGIYRAGRAQGLTSLIDGHGGDEVVSHGYGRLVELAAARRWGTLFRELRGAADVHDTPLLATYVGLIARHGGLPPRHILRRVLMRLSRALAPATPKPPVALTPNALLAAPLRAAVEPETRYAPTPPLSTPEEFRRAEALSHLDNVDSALMEHAFEVLHQSASAAGIVPRYPFFERRLVEFCLAMPAEAKLRDGATRWVLRAATTGLLPEKIRTRTTKADFTPEFREAIRIYLDETGDSITAGTEAFVDPDAARSLERHLRDNPEADIRLARAWWRILVLRDWLRALARWQQLQPTGELLDR